MIDFVALAAIVVLTVAAGSLVLRGHLWLPVLFAAAVLLIGTAMSVYSSKRFDDRCRAEGGTVHHGGKADLCVNVDGGIIRITVD